LTRKTFHQFVTITDRPPRFISDTVLSDREITALFEARKRCGNLIDHIKAIVPSSADLPTSDAVAHCHDDLVAAAQHELDAAKGPARTIRITAENSAKAFELAQILDQLARVREACLVAAWAEPFRVAALRGQPDQWSERMRERMTEWTSAADERASLLRRSTETPDGLIDSQDARDAIARGALGQRVWPLVSLGKGNAKALVNGIRLDGSPLKDDDQEGWRHVLSVLANLDRQREAKARWESFAKEIGAPVDENAKAAVDFAVHVLRVCDEGRKQRIVLGPILANAYFVEGLADEPELCRALANQIRAGASAARLAAAREVRQRMLAAFDGGDRTSKLAQQLIAEAIGNSALPSDKITAAWSGILRRLEQLKALSRDFEVIDATTEAIAAAGAPDWANKLRLTVAETDESIATTAWREAWDHAAAEAALERIDARQRLLDLAKERDAAERQCRRLFGEIVRERTFYTLDQRLSPSIKAALVEFVRALARIGRGTGKTAWAHRRTARDAMARCYGAVPCWIMPTWRVAEQLPAELGVLDLVIIDEASQSDVTELPALLRGKKILVVGDDRQVSPTAPFVTQEKIGQLRHHYLGDMPFKSLLEPGESIYDLMRAVFPNERLMLKEHFRCVEPIIRFSMQFYPEKMLPLRIPAAQERLDPPLIDIYVPHGVRGKNKKINPAEADVIVEDIAILTSKPEMRDRTIGVISLIGKEQAEHIRSRLSETIGEEIMQRHSILCGDSATFQGSERDIVYLSMVADSANKTALTMLRYEQRFNVAVSRGRDRVVLVRSVTREELNPNDLKARLIAHFENPMPEREDTSDSLTTCESIFERDLMQRLLDQGYRVQGQVGSLGYRIDMVVEGLDGTRLAVECDGDRFHGPEQWQQDMRRQRTLERVGWRFWRCFASSFYRNPDAVMSDLFEMLTRLGIEPVPKTVGDKLTHRFTEHRIVKLQPLQPETPESVALSDEDAAPAVVDSGLRAGIKLGDKVVLVFSDDQKRISARLVDGANDLEKGRLSINSVLGRAVLEAEEGDEVDLHLENGAQRKVLIESLDKGIYQAAPERSSAAAATVP
jgi:very-short-patch-repair endonuclease